MASDKIQVTASRVACVALPLAGIMVARFLHDVQRIRFPAPFLDLKTKQQHREVRPFSDMVTHVILFKYLRKLIRDGWLFQLVLDRLNSKFQTWDVPFLDQGMDPETEVVAFCKHWGVPLEPWEWSKPASGYKTMNEWFTRSYADSLRPERHLGSSAVVTPATAVVTWFPSAHSMPRVLKNDDFTIADVGIPQFEAYLSHPAALAYLAPADYHCYHSPISGVLTTCELLNQERYSVTVKEYIYPEVNILTRNRRAVMVLESADVSCGPSPLRVALVIVGGVTVDSIRLEPGIRKGAQISKGQLLGSFARGGSSIAILFNRAVELVPEAVAATNAGLDFKLGVGQSLAELVM